MPGHVVTLFASFAVSRWLGAAVTVAGLAGALLAVYVGDPRRMPHLGGSETAANLEQDIDWARRTWRSQIHNCKKSCITDEIPQTCRSIGNFYSMVDSSLRWENRALQMRAILLFPTIGCFVAAMFAQNILQAFLIGMVWPSTIGKSQLLRQIDGIKAAANSAVAENNSQHLRTLETVQQEQQDQLKETAESLSLLFESQDKFQNDMTEMTMKTISYLSQWPSVVDLRNMHSCCRPPTPPTEEDTL